ncbi:hypothetical protein ACR79T_10170 [Sphingobacterium spiritivorum]|uniref:hypothetical protein n=1 Tax=Sphingobacterium spiritivorum TaxID=258 RepID=UPI003DA2C706
MLQNLIHNWLLSGADPQVGYRLFVDYTEPNTSVNRIISKSPQRYLQVIKITLLRAAKLPYSVEVSARRDDAIQPLKDEHRKLRTEWNFLSDHDCPAELKLLITDKITAYRNCIDTYGKLSDATSKDQQLANVRYLVQNFINNHSIYLELKHYRDHKKILGRHAVFEQYNRIKEIRQLPTLDLFKKKKNIEHAIWRNSKKIKTEKRSDLLLQRQEKIKELQIQLSEVIRLLE